MIVTLDQAAALRSIWHEPTHLVGYLTQAGQSVKGSVSWLVNQAAAS